MHPRGTGRTDERRIRVPSDPFHLRTQRQDRNVLVAQAVDLVRRDIDIAASVIGKVAHQSIDCEKKQSLETDEPASTSAPGSNFSTQTWAMSNTNQNCEIIISLKPFHANRANADRETQQDHEHADDILSLGV